MYCEDNNLLLITLNLIRVAETVWIFFFTLLSFFHYLMYIIKDAFVYKYLGYIG